MKEHRALERYDLELPMLIKGVDIRNIPFTEFTKTLNISSGGAYFLIESKTNKGSRLQATLSLPRKIRNQIDMEGTVVRIENRSNGDAHKQGIGFCFAPDQVLEI